jgi:formylglycine-generating enzyme required for sulfatase activity
LTKNVFACARCQKLMCRKHQSQDDTRMCLLCAEEVRAEVIRRPFTAAPASVSAWPATAVAPSAPQPAPTVPVPAPKPPVTPAPAAETAPPRLQPSPPSIVRTAVDTAPSTAPSAKKEPELERFTNAKAVVESQTAWREFLGCEATISDSSGMELVLVPAGFVSLDLENGEEPEWVKLPRPFWVTRRALEAQAIRRLFQMAADHGDVRFAKLLATTTFLRKTTEGFTVSAEDILGLCQFLNREFSATYRLPTELEWLAAVSLFGETSAESVWKSALGVEAHCGPQEWTGTIFCPLRASPKAGAVTSGVRAPFVVRSAGSSQRRNAGSVNSMTVGGVRLVKPIQAR